MGRFFDRFRRRKPDLVEREEVELDNRERCPKLSSLKKPLEYYIRLYEQSYSIRDELPQDIKPGDDDWDWFVRQVRNSYSNRVVANWGMIAKGTASIPYALGMLKSKNADVREDGAGVLMAVGQREGVLEELLNALDREIEPQVRDSVIAALGAI